MIDRGECVVYTFMRNIDVMPRISHEFARASSLAMTLPQTFEFCVP
jgi:hypothetical protein